MNETQRNIKAYKEALPGIRERVVAMAMLLVMSLVMMSSATYAWLLISTAPEVSGANTTVASNGNLEIALAGRMVTLGELYPEQYPEGTPGRDNLVLQPPEVSKVGDSTAKEGQTVAAANLTWGNLVNLSDASYGLENLTLRPAQLNTMSLLSSPLYGAAYAGDGRVSQLTSRFAYTSWNPPEGDIPGYFGVSNKNGVRAISSTTVEAVGAANTYLRMEEDAITKNLNAGSLYTSMAQNSTYMQSLATMMGLYMTDRMDNDGTYKNPVCAKEDIQNLRDMYVQFLEAFDAEAEAMAALLNLQLFLIGGEGSYDPYTGADILALTQTESNKLNAGKEVSLEAKQPDGTTKTLTGTIKISDAWTLIKDRNTISGDIAKLDALLAKDGEIRWSDANGMASIVKNLVNVGICTVDNGQGTVLTVNEIGAQAAMNYMNKNNVATITNGILYNFELRTGAYLEVKGMVIKVSAKRSFINLKDQKVNADIKTSAKEVGYTHSNNDLIYTQSLNDGTFEGGTAVAADTYGLAVDLWVRTNAGRSRGSSGDVTAYGSGPTYLTLEGNVLTFVDEDNPVQVTTQDPNGNTVDVYTLSVTGEDEEGNSVTNTIDLYPIEKDGTTTWYLVGSHVPYELAEGEEPIRKKEVPVTIIGFEGENRVWQEGSNLGLSTDSTTQGSGSCYVYYADTPEDQERSLKLLEAMRVAFVDEQGKLLTTAVMDTAMAYEANGRITVPLVLKPDTSILVGTDANDESIYGITELYKNETTRITAIVYLDGTQLTNNDVLAAADIQGQLNIQFGSSSDMEELRDETLELAERSVSATVDVTEFDYDTHTGPMTSTVTVNVNGEQPTTMTAFFLRAINATQGTRQEPMTFTKNGESWTASHTFKSPGTYVLRTIRLDGVDYDLAEPQTVTITGFKVASLTGGNVNIMTADSSGSATLKLKFEADSMEKMPNRVQGRYIREGVSTNVDFTYNATTQEWTGKATFLTSGTYTMEYLVLDGEYVGLPESQWQTATVTLGMKVQVFTSSPTNIVYKAAGMAENEKNLAMQVKIMDNTGKVMPGLSGAKLSYNTKGSSTNRMDTDLAWDGDYYVGELPVTKPGIWQFGSVSVTTINNISTITTATNCPVFTILTPEPPAYEGHGTLSYQYAPNKDAYMTVEVSQSAAAGVQAVIKNLESGKTYTVPGTIGAETDEVNLTYKWNFKVPMVDNNGNVPPDTETNFTNYNQDGNWQIVELHLSDVFDEDGNQYTTDEPMVIDVSDQTIKTKAVNRVVVTFAKDLSQNFNGTFMQSHTVSGLNVDIKDHQNQPVLDARGNNAVSDVKLTFTYVNGSYSTYGGYNTSGVNNTTEGATITVPLTDDGNGHFVQTTDVNFRYAGNYTTKISFKVAGDNVAERIYEGTALPANAPKFTVSSAKPVVTITATTPSGSHTTLMNEADKTVTSGFSENTATVYVEANKSGSGKITTYPTVTLKIQNMGTASEASMEFTESKGGTVYMYTGKDMSGQTNAYVWTNDGTGTATCQRYIGQFKASSSCRGMTAEGAGILNGSSVVLTHDGNDYTFAVDTMITIKNEQSN